MLGLKKKLENRIFFLGSKKNIKIVEAKKAELAAESEDLKVFHAGTIFEEGSIKSNGGRVLCVTTLGESVLLAQKKAYDAISKIKWKDCFYRNDIGYRAIEREKS